MVRALCVACVFTLLAGCHWISNSTKTPQNDVPPAIMPGPRASRPIEEDIAREAERFQATVTAREKELRRPRLQSAEEESPREDALSRAAMALEQGNAEEAARQLSRHVQQHPDQIVFRGQLAELLLKLQKLPEAQKEFEQISSLAQSGNAAARKHIVHAHTRLMEIAQQREDKYAEKLHRGIGLYRVAEQLEQQADDPSETERLLFRAANELKEAQTSRTDDGRASWYLYLVWVRLDQPRPAEKALRKAVASAPFSPFTPAELQELHLAEANTPRR